MCSRLEKKKKEKKKNRDRHVFKKHTVKKTLEEEVWT